MVGLWVIREAGQVKVTKDGKGSLNPETVRGTTRR